MSLLPDPKRPTPFFKKLLRLFTLAAVVSFIFLELLVRHSRQKPVEMQFKSLAELAKIAPSQDSYPCLLIERSGQRLLANLTTCSPALHNDSAIEQYEVDLRSGRFTLRQTDLFVADSMPLALTRGYRLWDDKSRAFGIGGNHVYDIFPYGDRFPYTYMELFLGDGVTVHYDRISEGTSYADDVEEHRGTGNTVFQNSRIAWNRDHWDMTFRDGTLYRFPEAYYAKRGVDGALIYMRDPRGEEIRMFRDALHNLRSITSPAGHWIRFAYDDNNRVLEASDDARESTRYSYDQRGRLSYVHKGDSLLWRYAYDNTGISTVDRGGNATVIRNSYARDRIASITIEKQGSYGFEYLFGKPGRVVETTVSGPDGKKAVFKF